MGFGVIWFMHSSYIHDIKTNKVFNNYTISVDLENCRKLENIKGTQEGDTDRPYTIHHQRKCMIWKCWGQDLSTLGPSPIICPSCLHYQPAFPQHTCILLNLMIVFFFRNCLYKQLSLRLFKNLKQFFKSKKIFV